MTVGCALFPSDYLKIHSLYLLTKKSNNILVLVGISVIYYYQMVKNMQHQKYIQPYVCTFSMLLFLLFRLQSSNTTVSQFYWSQHQHHFHYSLTLVWSRWDRVLAISLTDFTFGGDMNPSLMS